VRHADRFVERHENEWPIARTQWTKFHLDPAAQVLSREPSRTAASIAFDALGDGLTFLSSPLERETEITGRSASSASSSTSTPTSSSSFACSPPTCAK
jgi:hypothetical protein